MVVMVQSPGHHASHPPIQSLLMSTIHSIVANVLLNLFLDFKLRFLHIEVMFVVYYANSLFNFIRLVGVLHTSTMRFVSCQLLILERQIFCGKYVKLCGTLGKQCSLDSVLSKDYKLIYV